MIAGAWPLLLGAAASAATLAGGVVALRLRRRIEVVIGLSAGIVLGVALLDLLPLALELAPGAGSARGAVAAMGAGFLAYLLADRLLDRLPGVGRRLRARIGPASLTLHSLVDGIGIGVAFSVSPAIGWGVAAAVLSHDIADGINIVGLTLAAEDDRAARRWLLVNAIAPPAGVLAGRLVAIPSTAVQPVVAVLAGVFLYIGAVELLPRGARSDRPVATALASALGIGLIALVAWLQG